MQATVALLLTLVLFPGLAAAGGAQPVRVRVQGAQSEKVAGSPIPNCPTPIDPVPLPANGSLPEDIMLALEDIDDLFESVLTNPALSDIERKTIALSSCMTLNDQVLKCSQFSGSDTNRPNASTIFRIGSVTKTFTALAAFQLAERGVLSLDDPIVKYLPSFSIQNPWNYVQGPITIRQALSFLSGLPRSTPCTYGCNVTAEEMFARIATLSVGTPQWSAPRYSNLGISLVGHALEAASGIPLDQYIEDNILSVLNMTSTGFKLTPEVRARLIAGYNEFAPGVPVELVDMGWDAPAGGMYSTAEDLAKYVIALNAPLGSRQKLFLYDATLSEFLLSVFPNSDASTSFGMTWLTLLFTDGARLITKSGAVPGFMSEVTIVQGRNLGLVTLYNYLSSFSTTTTNVQAVGMILPSIDSFYINNQSPATVVPGASAFIGNYTQDAGTSTSATVEIAPLANGPAGTLGLSTGGAFQGYLVPSPTETRLGFKSFWLRYSIVGDEPCAATEFSALDSMEILFYYSNTTVVSSSSSSSSPSSSSSSVTADTLPVGLYLGDIWTQDPFVRQ